MAIGQIELRGMDLRTQDFSILKHNEDNKPVHDQQMISGNFQQASETKGRTVVQSESKSDVNAQGDGRSSSGNQYAGDGGANRKNAKKANLDGKVFLKQSGSFDLKI